MENRRAVIAILVTLLLLPEGVFAYEPTTTHRALTREVYEFYNVNAGAMGTPALSVSDRDAMERGAMDEDNDYRMAHHFYDPIYGRGLKGYMSSKAWATDPAYQASWKYFPSGCGPQSHTIYPLFESPCDHSWQRAIYEYVYGDKTRAMESLGHTLHLIEDATVPDHTRNDSHIPYGDFVIEMVDEGMKQQSPFENFLDKYSIENGNVQTASELRREGSTPYVRGDLVAYFDNAALYSNTNFFSKSTIFDPSYSLPVIEGRKNIKIDDKEHQFGIYDDHLLLEVITHFDPGTL